MALSVCVKKGDGDGFCKILQFALKKGDALKKGTGTVSARFCNSICVLCKSNRHDRWNMAKLVTFHAKSVSLWALHNGTDFS